MNSRLEEYRKKSIDWMLILNQGGTYFSVWVVDTLYAMPYAYAFLLQEGKTEPGDIGDDGQYQ